MSLTPSPSPKIIPVILCGGRGSRLWPLSHDKMPKQFHAIIGEMPLLAETINRALYCTNVNAKDIITITSEAYRADIPRYLEQINPALTSHILYEPEAKNTAAAIAYATHYAIENFGDDILLWFLPIDHHIEEWDALKKYMELAAPLTQQGKIFTFGMKPTSADTHYGYIEKGQELCADIYAVANFYEKPNAPQAEKYFQSPDFFWNSGMFLSAAQTIKENFKKHAPIFYRGFEDIEIHYNSLPALSFDIAIMEKTQDAALIPCDIKWSDIGSWQSIWNVQDKDILGNAIKGEVSLSNTQDCLIHSNSMKIATMGLKDLIIVEHDQNILVADRNTNQTLTKLLKNKEGLHSHDRYEIHEQIIAPQDGFILSVAEDEKIQLIALSGEIELENLDGEMISFTQDCPFIAQGDESYSLTNPYDIPFKFLKITSRG